MWIAFIALIFGGLVAVLNALLNPITTLPTKSIPQAGVTMQYETFVQTSIEYMSYHPTASGNVNWAQQSPSTAVLAAMTTPIPSTWVLKILGGGAWVICTPMDSMSIQYILPRVPSNNVPYVKNGTTLSTSDTTAHAIAFSIYC